MKILFVYPEVSNITGGGVLTSVIRESLLGSAHTVYEYHYSLYKTKLDKLKNQVLGFTMGMTNDHQNDILNLINQYEIDYVIFNTSRAGCVAENVKKKRPDVKILTIFHNVEVKFCYNGFKVNHNPFSLLTIFVTWLNEKSAIKYSDSIITLNERDSASLLKLYKRPADCIMPLCLKDRFVRENLKTLSASNEIKGGFIGSNFYANNKGIKWFCENVVSHLNCKILVIGKGFEDESEYFKNYPNIILIGTVDNIDKYYYDLDFIVSPIFDGSGMKTKTAEALMFGKYIIGTPEAFEGYKLEYENVGALCVSSVDFIEAIKPFERKEFKRFNEYSRTMYEKNYSEKKLNDILLNLIK